MAKRDGQLWSTIVAEAEIAGVPHGEIAAKYGVSLPALKYHLQKARKLGTQTPRILPVRTTGELRTFQLEFGAVRVTFAEGCEPEYVAAVASALAKTC